MPESWEYTLYLPNDPRSVTVSRRTLRLILTMHGLIRLVDVAELLAAELVSNAVRHTKGPAALRVRRSPEGVVWIAPCEKLVTVSGVAVPNPTWVLPRPAPNDWVTRSLKLISAALNPVEFMLARLLPTTSMAVEVAFSAERAVENEVNIRFSV